MNRISLALALAVLAAGSSMPLFGEASAPAADKPAVVAQTTRPAPAPLSEQTKKGLAWLAKQQLENGAWGQGEESQQMGGGSKLAAVPNVADTSMAVLALLRSGSTPKEGPYKDQINKGVAFICSQIQGADEKSLYITAQHDTRTQQKLGTYIDTFLAAQVLGELRRNMADDATNKLVMTSLDKVVGKIELNQKDDGKFASDGWAPTLMQGQASKAINIVVANGGKVNEKVRERIETNAQREHAATVSGPVAVGGSSTVAGTAAISGNAGVQLYTSGATLTALQNAELVNGDLRKKAEEVLNSPSATQPAKDEAKAQIERFDKNTQALADAQKDVAQKLQDPRFVAGFGSNGGEEFLSYLNIGESLFIKGGEEWKTWNDKITTNLQKVQNADGSWSGHHCITGRTFCTSAALMVLMVDRAPEGSSAKLTQKPK